MWHRYLVYCWYLWYNCIWLTLSNFYKICWISIYISRVTCTYIICFICIFANIFYSCGENFATTCHFLSLFTAKCDNYICLCIYQLHVHKGNQIMFIIQKQDMLFHLGGLLLFLDNLRHLCTYKQIETSYSSLTAYWKKSTSLPI